MSIATVSHTPVVIRPRADLLDQYPQIKRSQQALARSYAAQAYVNDETLAAVGRQLYAAADADGSLSAAFSEALASAGNQIVPIVVESDSPAVQQLPWETLAHPDHGFVARSTRFTLTRHVGVPTTDNTPFDTGPLRVLLFTSSPDDLDAECSRLNVEDEQAQVLEAFNVWVKDGLVDLEMPDDGRFATLAKLIRDFNPHVLYLSGHGTFIDHSQTGDKSPDAYFWFENEDGRSEKVPSQQITALLPGSAVQCVVLSACESGKGTSDDLTAGLTWRLANSGITHVVGMRESVLDNAGIQFAGAFCQALAQRERVDVAIQRGRAAMTQPLKGLWRDQERPGMAEASLGQWCLPLLISRDARQPLIDWAFEPQPPPQLLSELLNNITLPPRFIGRRPNCARCAAACGAASASSCC